MSLFLDANVFVYAAGAPSPWRAPCLGVLRAVADGRLHATTSVEVAQEVLHVLCRRGARAEGLAIVRAMTGLFPAMLAVAPDDLLAACEIVARHDGMPVRDALHAATALRAGCDAIVSYDLDFDRIDSVRRLTPEAVTA